MDGAREGLEGGRWLVQSTGRRKKEGKMKSGSGEAGDMSGEGINRGRERGG